MWRSPRIPTALQAYSAALMRASLARMDKLEEIFQMQDALNRRIGVNLPPATEEEKTRWILNYTRAMQQETAELIDSVPEFPWYKIAEEDFDFLGHRVRWRYGKLYLDISKKALGRIRDELRRRTRQTEYHPVVPDLAKTRGLFRRLS